MKLIDDALAILPIDRSLAINQINQAIATLQSGAGQTAVTQAMQMLQQASSDKFTQQGLDIQKQQANTEKYKVENPFGDLNKFAQSFGLKTA